MMEELSKALVAFQAELTPVGKSASNPFFKSKYAPLNEVVALVNPLLAKHKLAVLQPMAALNDGAPALKTILVHESGQSIEEITPLFLVKEDPQSHGSAVTYARRYGLMSMLGIVADEDDDGNKATGSYAKNQTYQSKPKEVQVRSKDAVADPFPASPTELGRRKGKINEWLNEIGYTLPEQKKTFIVTTLGKATVDNLDDADALADAIDNVRD